MNLMPTLKGDNAFNIPAPRKREPGEGPQQSSLFDNGLPDHIRRRHLVVDFNYDEIDQLKAKMIESKNMVTVMTNVVDYVERESGLENDDAITKLVEVLKEEMEIVNFANQCRASIIAL